MGVLAVVDVFVDCEGDGRRADYFAGEPADALLEGGGEVSFCGVGEEGTGGGWRYHGEDCIEIIGEGLVLGGCQSKQLVICLL